MNVRVTRHAVDQLRKRFPADAPVEHPVCCQLIGREVSAAILAGRMAVRQPRWMLREGTEQRCRATRHNGVETRTARYVWNIDQSRAYLVKRDSGVVVVVTTILPRAAKPSDVHGYRQSVSVEVAKAFGGAA